MGYVSEDLWRQVSRSQTSFMIECCGTMNTNQPTTQTLKMTATTYTETPSMITSREAIASRWLRGEHTVPTEDGRTAFRLWLLSEFRAMRASGIEPLFVTRDVPIDEAMASLSRPMLPGEIRWLPVSRLFNDPNLDLMSQNQNLMFRAVHDWTHWKEQAGANWEGELAVTLAHIRSAPECIHWILWSEVAGQAAVQLTTGKFPPQKIVRL